MRNWNALNKWDLVKNKEIFTLPMRNWNVNVGNIAGVALTDFYSTYEELKHQKDKK